MLQRAVDTPQTTPTPVARLSAGWAVFMALQMSLWALSYPIVALATTGPGSLNGFEVTGLRATLGSLVLLPALIATGFRHALPSTKDCLRILGWGAWYFGAAQTLFNAAIDIGGPVLSGVIFAGFPITLTLLAAALGVEQWDRRALPYVLLALAGAVVVVTKGDLSRLTVLTEDLRATLLMLGCLAMVAAYSIGAKRLLQTTEPLTFVAIACSGGALALLAAGYAFGSPFLERLPDLPPQPRWALYYLVMVNTVGTEWMSMTGLRRLPILIVAVFNYLQPPLVAVFSLLVPGSGAVLGWPLVIGGLAILIGASTVGTLQPGHPPWPQALLRRIRSG